MPNFTTQNGEASYNWSTRITVGDVLRVQEKTGVLLPSLADDGCKPLGELRDDLKKLVDILWVLVEPQAEKANVTDEKFVQSLGGEGIYGGYMALVEGLKDFFLESPDKEHVGKMIGAIMSKAAEVVNYQGQVTEKAVQQVNQMKVEQLVKKSGSPASGSQGSSGSNRGRSRSKS